jgi:hypothetical protein
LNANIDKRKERFLDKNHVRGTLYILILGIVYFVAKDAQTAINASSAPALYFLTVDSITKKGVVIKHMKSKIIIGIIISSLIYAIWKKFDIAYIFLLSYFFVVMNIIPIVNKDLESVK